MKTEQELLQAALNWGLLIRDMEDKLRHIPFGAPERATVIDRLRRAEHRLKKAVEEYEAATADEADFCEVCEYERCKCYDEDDYDRY